MSGRGTMNNGMVMYGVPPIDPQPWPGTTPDQFPGWPDPLTPPEQAEAARILGQVKNDAESIAMTQVMAAFAAVDDAAKARIAAYVASRWGTK